MAWGALGKKTNEMLLTTGKSLKRPAASSPRAASMFFLRIFLVRLVATQ